MLPVVLIELLPRVEMRAADFAIEFVCVCHLNLQ
jgi:hypothetical protein